MIKCLIIEDEKAAQEVLQFYIEKTPFVECIGVFESGSDISPAKLSQADLLFLDIQLPELNGLAYLKSLANPPKVIVTTAYPEHAVDAFEIHVADYLLKPFSYERFFKASMRVQNQIESEAKIMNKQIYLYADKTIYKTAVDDMLYLKAEIDYVKIVMKEKSILILDSMRNWEEKLSIYNFVRTHRSYIINVDKIDKILKNQVFINNEVIPIGKNYRDGVYKQIGYKS